jgi:acyl carrier protein
MTHAEVLEGVRECLAKVLDIPVESIHEDSRIIQDLGADSLDFLDLSFHIQQKFGVSFSPRDDERRLQEKLGSVAVQNNGAYTPEALRELRKNMPEVPPEEFAEGMAVSALPFLFRVSTIVNLILRLKEGQDVQ